MSSLGHHHSRRRRRPPPRGLAMGCFACFLILLLYQQHRLTDYLSAAAADASDYMDLYKSASFRNLLKEHNARANRPTNHSVAFLTVTGHRPNGTFYFDLTLRGLRDAGVPDSAILVNNYSGKNNTALYSYLDRTCRGS